MSKIMFSAVINQEDLTRLEWFFEDKRPRKSFAGRTQTRFSPNVDGSPVELENTFQTSFGRYHSFVRTTNGATVDLEISCKLKGIERKSLVFLQVYKGRSAKSYHFIATPYKGCHDPGDFKIIRKPHCIKFEFGFRREFKLLREDIATGSGRSQNSPQSIMWGEADRFRFNCDVTFDENGTPTVWENPKFQGEDDSPFQRIRPLRGRNAE